MSADQLHRLASGDLSAMESLFKEHFAPLSIFAFQYLKDRDQAEDLVQELFIRIWEGRSELQVKTSIKAYLYASVRNRCLNALKAAKRVVPLDAVGQEPMEEEEGDEDLLTLRAARVRAAIEGLPEERRKVFRMSRYEGLKYQEIADRLGISAKTVENQMGKALKTLRVELADLMPLIAWLLHIADHNG
ncbi:MAG: RNA polymerase sigma-70 factor [Flavobacteriales bacterium]|nr:RNA polymerase sigma-70 factor [Flavobacteriales bacterium]